MQKDKPERLLWKIPNKLWLLGTENPGCVMHKIGTIVFVCVSAVFAGLTAIILVWFPYSFWASVLFGFLFAIFLSMSILFLLPTIFIRKGCYACQFGFYIVAHERNHLLLGTNDELSVEKETLEQVGHQLAATFLSDPKMCRNCPFLRGESSYMNRLGIKT